MRGREGGGGAGLPRRRLLQFLAAAGLGDAVFGRALATVAEGRPKVTARMIARASWIAGIELTEDERRLMLDGIDELLADYRENRAVVLTNQVPPPLLFRPAARPVAPVEPPRAELAPAPEPRRPPTDDELAFAPVAVLARLLRSRQVSSVELTRLYLERLGRIGPRLECVISVIPGVAMEQAEAADREIAAGRWRGPLHGIPWGVKDLMAVPGTRTTWGALPYRNQVLAEKATAVARLEEAGAVLAAKLTLGALALGDVWFGGQTRNPWKPEQGSEGSSAGSAAATAAGLVGFALGTETWGSMVIPATRCGATCLRPTYGRVSRHGVMTLAWSFDKVGPLARSVEDCALVFAAIAGADGLDPAATDAPFRWPSPEDPRTLRVGYVADLFEKQRIGPRKRGPRADVERRRRWREIDLQTLDTLRRLGLELIPVELPRAHPADSLGLIADAESACVFDALTRGGRSTLLSQPGREWPTPLRDGQMVSAVEYLRAQRIRSLVMGDMEELFAAVDVYVCPTYMGDNLLRTNLTGHPCVTVPNGFLDGTPTSITFTGRLYGESAVLAVAHAFQQATDFHRRRPPVG